MLKLIPFLHLEISAKVVDAPHDDRPRLTPIHGPQGDLYELGRLMVGNSAKGNDLIRCLQAFKSKFFREAPRV